MKTVCFAHGKESGPHGVKIEALAEIAARRGWQTVSPDFRVTRDADERVAMLLDRQRPQDDPLVLVGSSMGGYVTTVASRHLAPAGLFLMAPAFYLPGYRCREPRPVAARTTVVHGWRDDVVPAANAVRFARQFRTELHLVDDDHALRGSIPLLCLLFEQFLDHIDRIGR